jgi:taspase, threonine aspartase, 1
MHPIHVARLVLEGSTKRLSLRRVPPNLLVGQGAIDFAFENQVPILPLDSVISSSALERYKRWMKDLETLDERSGSKNKKLVRLLLPDLGKANLQKQSAGVTPPKRPLMEALTNEAQPATPVPLLDSSNIPILTMPATPVPSSPLNNGKFCFTRFVEIGPANTLEGRTVEVTARTNPSGNGQNGYIRDDSSEATLDLDNAIYSDPSVATSSRPLQSNPKFGTDGTCEIGGAFESLSLNYPVAPGLVGSPDDFITDTVGAIAIDSFGNIAAGSSSGGIGMKHKGRTGPAALVGVGTAVHPINSNDKECKCTAVVTSGTGEHMATTLAAGTCADRLYYNLKLSPQGRLVEADDEDSMQSFVKNEFMGKIAMVFKF